MPMLIQVIPHDQRIVNHLGLMYICSQTVILQISCETELILYDRFTENMVLKGLLSATLGNLLGDKTHWVNTIGLFTNGLKRQFFGDTGKAFTLHIHCSGVPGDRVFSVGVLVRWPCIYFKGLTNYYYYFLCINIYIYIYIYIYILLL